MKFKNLNVASRILSLNIFIIVIVALVVTVSSIVNFKQELVRQAIIGIILVGMTAVLNFLIVRKGLAPLKDAADVMTRVTEGDLTVHIASDGNDEVGVILAAMDKMVLNMKHMISQVQSFAESIASGSEQLKASSEKISDTVNDEATQANQIATAAEEMTQTFADIAKTTSNIAASSSEAAQVARQGEEVVSRSVNETEKIALAVSESSEIMKFLGDRSKQIGAIVEVIKDIADQTNLLALNAAIEAARAGDHGRGFSVVADEVRKLAEKTTVSTSQIGNMIGSIQKEVEKAINAMEGASLKVGTGVALSQQAGSSLTNIVNGTTELQNMVQQIASATEIMSSVSEQISNDIQSVAGSSNEISLGSDQITAASNDLSRIATDLRMLVSKFKL